MWKIVLIIVIGFVSIFIRAEDHILTNETGATTLKKVEPPNLSFDCGIRGNADYPDRHLRPSTCARNSESGENEVDGSLDNKIKTSSRSKRSSEVRKSKNSPQFDSTPKLSGIGEVDAQRPSWPWMAILARRRGDDVKYFCNGVLINDQYVLTAAHCLLNPQPFFIRLGEHNFEINPFSGEPFNVHIENYTIHPQYKFNQGYHDLALIKLIHKIRIKDEVRPICLPWGSPSNVDLLGQCVTITGWGATRFAGQSTPQLQEVDVNVIDSVDCLQSYSTLPDFNSRFPEGINYENTLCAGDKLGGKDGCGGDSGGPLVYSEDGRWILGGIMSRGYGCDRKTFPGLYVPISNFNYLQWINDIAF